MKKWIETLSTGQKILVRTFFFLLGMTLLVIVFYAGGMEMLLLTEKKTDWTAMHSIFAGSGVVCIAISLALSRLTSVFDVVIQGGKKLIGIPSKPKNRENDNV